MCSLVCTNAVHMYSRCTLFSVTASRANCTIALTTRSSCAESGPCVVWSGWAVYVQYLVPMYTGSSSSPQPWCIVKFACRDFKRGFQIDFLPMTPKMDVSCMYELWHFLFVYATFASATRMLQLNIHTEASRQCNYLHNPCVMVTSVCPPLPLIAYCRLVPLE